jgi:hypothetical protein
VIVGVVVGIGVVGVLCVVVAVLCWRGCHNDAEPVVGEGAPPSVVSQVSTEENASSTTQIALPNSDVSDSYICCICHSKSPIPL